MAHERPLAHWPSYALLARASWYPRRTFAELVGRSRSWVEMAETGHRVPYNVLDLVSVAPALRAVVTAYRRLDDEIGSATLRPLVQHNVQIVKGLQTRSEDVGAALSTVAAELHQLAGWLSFDTGDYDAASGHYRAGLRAAEHAGNDAMAAHVLGWMSYLASTTTHAPARREAASRRSDRRRLTWPPPTQPTIPSSSTHSTRPCCSLTPAS